MLLAALMIIELTRSQSRSARKEEKRQLEFKQLEEHKEKLLIQIENLQREVEQLKALKEEIFRNVKDSDY